jgi:hypothetical protein
VTQRDRIVLAVLGVAGVLAAYWFLMLGPKTDELKTARDAADTARARSAAATQKLATAQAAKAAYGRQLATVARVGKAVPTDDDTASLMYQINHTADHLGVNFWKLSLEPTGAGSASATAAAGGSADAPGSVPGPNGLRQMPFTFGFEGQFFGLRKFLSSLHGFARWNGDDMDVHGRLLGVDAFALEPGPGGFPAVSASILANAYYAPAPLDTAGTTGAPGAAAAAGTPAAGGTTTPPTGTSSGTTAASGSTPPPAVIGGLR